MGKGSLGESSQDAGDCSTKSSKRLVIKDVHPDTGSKIVSKTQLILVSIQLGFLPAHNKHLPINLCVDRGTEGMQPGVADAMEEPKFGEQSEGASARPSRFNCCSSPSIKKLELCRGKLLGIQLSVQVLACLKPLAAVPAE